MASGSLAIENNYCEVEQDEEVGARLLRPNFPEQAAYDGSAGMKGLKGIESP